MEASDAPRNQNPCEGRAIEGDQQNGQWHGH